MTTTTVGIDFLGVADGERENELAMTAATMGIDFPGVVEDGAAHPTPTTPRACSTRGVQHSMAPKLNTQQERTGVTNYLAAPAVAAAEFVAGPPVNLLSFSMLPSGSAEQHRRFLAPTPPGSPASRSAADTSPGAVAPLTIFYNGTVATFNLPRDKAEAVINWAERTTPGFRRVEIRPDVAFVDDCGRQQQPPQTFPLDGFGRQQPPPPPQTTSLDKIRGDLPLARKKSLQRFLNHKKRKERPGGESFCLPLP